MKSMTGFGKASSHSNDYHLDVTVRAVNGRFFEVKFHGPTIYKGLETEIRKKVSQQMQRGTIDIYFNRKVLKGSETVLFNKKLAKKWLNGFSAMAKDLGLKPPQDAQVLLSIPDLVSVDEAGNIGSSEKNILNATLDKALIACDKVRSVEGKGLKKDIQGHLKNLGQQVSKIKKLREQTKKDLQKRYQKKLEGYELPGEIDEQRVAQEIVIQVDKSDISEEIQRLEAHIKAIGKLVQTTGAIGKKMDFYAQELLREVNTIGSKSTSSELTQEVVEAKGLIEKYREQVQNVE